MATFLQESDTPLQQYARPILAVLAGLGGLLTAYLTINKLTEQKVAFCGTGGGCDLVLASRWATFLGIPTAALGLAGFLAVLLLAVLPNQIPLVKKWRWPGLFAILSSMMTFELYMLYLMVGELKQFCLYCSIAIVLVTSLFGITLLGHRWLDWGKLIFNGALIGLLTLTVTIGVYANQTLPPSQIAVGLAKHLKEVDGTMYGAHWCPHCLEQKALFGAAFKDVPYVECSPNGGPGSPPAQICIDKGVQSYPTWIIKGQTYGGVRSLEALSRASDYQPE